MSDNFSFRLVRRSERALFSTAVLVFALLLLPGDGYAADQIAVIDTKRVMSALAEHRGLQERLEEERTKLTRRLKKLAESVEDLNDDLEKNRLNLSEIELRRRDRELKRGQNELQLMRQQLQEELSSREQEEILLLRSELNSVVKNFLKNKKYDMVLFSDALAGFKPSLDISNDLISVIKSTPVKKSSK